MNRLLQVVVTLIVVAPILALGDQSSPRATITEYVEACRAGSVERLRAIFHPEALMSGFRQGQFYIGSPEPFFSAVANNSSPADSDADYVGEISTVEISGDVASVTLKESGFMGSDFTDWFQLSRLDGVWVITSKAFQAE